MPWQPVTTATLWQQQREHTQPAQPFPYNYSVGVNGGVDIITNTIHLGVDKYIEQPEANGKLPTRIQISLDTHNISRQKLWRKNSQN